MASYSSPTLQDVQDVTAVNLFALGMEQPELESVITLMRARAEANLAVAITAAKFTDTGLSAYEVTTLQEAVCYGVAARWLRRCAMEKTEGTHEPLLVEDSRSIMEIVAEFEAKFSELATFIASGPGTLSATLRSSFTTDDAPSFSRTTVW